MWGHHRGPQRAAAASPVNSSTGRKSSLLALRLMEAKRQCSLGAPARGPGKLPLPYWGWQGPGRRPAQSRGCQISPPHSAASGSAKGAQQPHLQGPGMKMETWRAEATGLAPNLGLPAINPASMHGHLSRSPEGSTCLHRGGSASRRPISCWSRIGPAEITVTSGHGEAI